MKKLVLLVVITVVVIILASLLFFFLAMPSVTVEAKELSPYDSQYADHSLRNIAIFEGTNKIGTTFSEIKLLPGEHILRFADVQGYETPQSISINIGFQEKKSISIEYITDFGVLSISTDAYDPLSKAKTDVNAQIMIDGNLSGTNHTGVAFRGNELGSHTVSFAPIPGYSTPPSQNVLVEKGKTTWVSVDYQKILSVEDTHAIWLQDQTATLSDLPTNGANTLKFIDFAQWVLNNRVKIPMYYTTLLEYGGGRVDGVVQYAVAQYAGALPSDRTKALDNIYQNLLNAGIDLQSETFAGGWGGVHCYRVSNNQDCVILVVVQRTLKCESIEGSFYQYNQQSCDALPKLFPYVIPAGLDISFYHWTIYTEVSGTTQPINSIFSAFENAQGGTASGGSYDAYNDFSISSLTNYYLSNSVTQISTAINKGVLGAVLLDQSGFFANLRWSSNG